MAIRIPTGPNGALLSDDNLLIAMGCYEGISHINKFGSVVDAASDTDTDVWDGGGIYTFPDGTADMTKVSQTADQVAARGATVVVSGLDVNYVEVEQEVTLDASNTTTAVTLATPLMRVNRMWVKDAIVLTSTVRLHNTAETVDYADLQLDHNQTLHAIYTVPAGKTAYITSVEADHVPVTGKDPRSVHFHLTTRRNHESGGWRAVESFGVLQDGATFTRHFAPYVVLPQKTDIRIYAKPNGAAAHIHASFDLILVDNAQLR